MKNRIFLGGTCNETTWRDELINLIQVDWFNPVVEDWNEEWQKIKEEEKELRCDVHFYLIRKEMKGVFSIAEVIDSVHTRGKRTIFHVMPDGFDKSQLKSLQAVVNLVIKRGGIAFVDSDIKRSARIINNCFQP